MLYFLGRASLTTSAVLIVIAMGLIYSGFRVTGEATNASTVSMGDNFFSPASVTVAAGSTITWTQDGALPHTTTSDTGIWDSGLMTSGQTFSQAFSSPGTFTYNCAFHPEMVGTVVVEGSAPQPTEAPQVTPPPESNSPSTADSANPPGSDPALANQPGSQPASAQSDAAAMPVGGGPPPMDEGWFQGAMVLIALGVVLAMMGAGAIFAGAREERRRNA